jgi:hypothetical protein
MWVQRIRRTQRISRLHREGNAFLGGQRAERDVPIRMLAG